MRIKVQCISTNSGFYKKIQLGKWYEAEEYLRSYIIYGIPKLHSLDNDYGLFDKSLFRTIDEKRDLKLNKLGI